MPSAPKATAVMTVTEPADVVASVGSLPVDACLHGKFHLRAVLGDGGFSIVYLAHDESLEREVAIKEYLPAGLAMRGDGGRQVKTRTPGNCALFAEGLNRFVHEARILARLKHPSLAEVLHFFEENGTAYMVMPYYRGKTLREMLCDGFRVNSREELLDIVLPVLDGLSLAHSFGVCHLDISPDNILIRENDAPVLIDFGAARWAQGNGNAPRTVILKPGFAPIEQYGNYEDGAETGPWSDVYSLSAVIYQLVSGNMPARSVARVVRDLLPPLSGFASNDLPARILSVIDTGLAVLPQERPRTAAALAAALKSAARASHEPAPDKTRLTGVSISPADEDFDPLSLFDETKTGAPQNASPGRLSDDLFPIPEPANKAGEQAPARRPLRLAAAPDKRTPATSPETERLYDAFTSGLEMRLSERDALDEDFMKLIGQLLRHYTQGAVDLMNARATIKREFRSDVTQINPECNNPLKFSPDAEVALSYLLGHRFTGFMEPAEAVRQACDDLRAHEISVIAGARAAFNDMFAHFDPGAIEQEVTARGWVSENITFGRRQTRLWEAYQRYFQAMPESSNFFCAAFLKGYEESVAELHPGGDGAPP
ncbi:MAG: type VI secretion system-associated FHA domain protein TagH [Azoarcus sp.]|jgi:type VI secretion system FHA domain protein|nr:type VI secretion system-associated FHA domain protein TagH [Azoarcus sp.]